MKNKRNTGKQTRGWFPKESTPPTQSRTPYRDFTHSYKWPAAGVVVATAEGALLGLFGYLVGLARLFSFYGWLAITLLSVVITAAAWNAAWLKKQAHEGD